MTFSIRDVAPHLDPTADASLLCAAPVDVVELQHSDVIYAASGARGTKRVKGSLALLRLGALAPVALIGATGLKVALPPRTLSFRFGCSHSLTLVGKRIPMTMDQIMPGYH